MTFDAPERAKTLDRQMQTVLKPGDVGVMAAALQQAYNDGVEQGFLNARPDPNGKMIDVSKDGQRAWLML